MKSVFLFLVAGLLEVGGGYLVWLWLRNDRSLWLGLAGFICLALYGVVPILQPISNPFGRVYAAYGAVFIILSVLWGWFIDRHAPDIRDWLGMAVCLIGAIIMMWPRSPATIAH